MFRRVVLARLSFCMEPRFRKATSPLGNAFVVLGIESLKDSTSEASRRELPSHGLEHYWWAGAPILRSGEAGAVPESLVRPTDRVADGAL